MDLSELKKLLELMQSANLVELEIEEQGKHIRLKRADDRPVAAPVIHAISAPVAHPAAHAPASAAPPAAPAPAGTPGKRADNLVEFKSPLVGSFYRSARPDAEPFANVGDEVTAEKVICIIEAMKVMNEIKAEMHGVIREILVKNSQAVEFGEVLFLIEKK